MINLYISLLPFWILFFIQVFACAEISVPPIPDQETPSAQYKVYINGKEVPVWAAYCDKSELGNQYSFVSFDIQEPVDIQVQAAESFEAAVIRPDAYGVETSVEHNTITFKLDRPRKISVEPYGMKNVLLVFANPPETGIPDPNDSSVIFYGPGIHRVSGDVLRLNSGQTLYLAGGAVLKAAVYAEDAEHVTIRGRGMIDGSDWPWLKGPRGHLVGFRRCKRVLVDGVILRGAYGWTLVPVQCENVVVNNLKIVNDRVQNDDGINPCNSRQVIIRDCFIRTDDDCISIKGLRETGREPSEDITIENMVFWCSRARIILFAHESQAEAMRRIKISDSHIIHYTMTPFLLEPGEEMPLTDVVIENVRINALGRGEIARLRPTVNQYMSIKKPGSIQNIHFKNIDIASDNPDAVFFHLEGADAEHQVRQVTFEAIRINGEPAEKLSSLLRIKPFVSDVSAEGKPVGH